MLKEKKILITRQRFERIVIRQSGSSGEDFACPVCGEQEVMLSIEKSALVYEVSIRSVFRLLESGQIHFAELPSGQLLVCMASLEAEIKNLKP